MSKGGLIATLGNHADTYFVAYYDKGYGRNLPPALSQLLKPDSEEGKLRFGIHSVITAAISPFPASNPNGGVYAEYRRLMDPQRKVRSVMTKNMKEAYPALYEFVLANSDPEGSERTFEESTADEFVERVMVGEGIRVAFGAEAGQFYATLMGSEKFASNNLPGLMKTKMPLKVCRLGMGGSYLFLEKDGKRGADEQMNNLPEEITEWVTSKRNGYGLVTMLRLPVHPSCENHFLAAYADGDTLDSDGGLYFGDLEPDVKQERRQNFRTVAKLYAEDTLKSVGINLQKRQEEEQRQCIQQQQQQQQRAAMAQRTAMMQQASWNQAVQAQMQAAQNVAAMNAANAGLRAARMSAQALNNGFAVQDSVNGGQYHYRWQQGGGYYGNPGNF